MSLIVRTPRRSRPAMSPRWLVRKSMTPEIKAARPYLKRYGIRSRTLWVRNMQKHR